MARKKSISWLVIIFMFVSMFSGLQTLIPINVSAAGFGSAPTGWTTVEINNEGSPLSNSSTDYSNKSFTLSTTGGKLNSGFDSALFSYLSVTGDFVFTTRINPLTTGSTDSGGAIMVKNPDTSFTLDVAPEVDLAYRPSNSSKIATYKRTSAVSSGGTTGIKPSASGAIYLKMERSGGTFTTYMSTDGVTWGDGSNTGSALKSYNESSLTAATLNVGLAAFNSTVKFDNIKITQNSGTKVLFDSNEDISTPPAGSAPVPSSVTASVYEENKINIVWAGQNLAEDSSTSYLVEASTDNGTTYTTVTNYTYNTGKILASPFNFIYTPSASGSYLFKVTGKLGSISSTSVTTAAAYNYVLPLATPAITSCSLSDGIISLKWSTVAEAVYYDVNVFDAEGKLLSELCISKIAAPTNTATFTGLVNGSVYKFNVIAKRGAETTTSLISAPITYAADVIPTAPSWQSRAFGSSTTAATAVNKVSINSDTNVTVESTGGGGKISSNTDGISYYYTPLDSTKPFCLSAKVHVDSIYTNGGNNQVAFGLMLRNTVGTDGDSSGHLSNFVAVGDVYQRMRAFSRTNMSSLTQGSEFTSTAPKAGDEYTLSITKTEDNKCIVTIGATSYIVDTTNVFSGNKFYVGAFAARDAKVTFSDIKLVTGVTGLEMTSQPAKKEYLQGQSLDLTGLKLTAHNSDDSTKVLSSSDYVVAGYDPNTLGNQTVSVYYGGKSASFDVNVIKLTCVGINMLYTPAKTTYYLNDTLDTLGMVVNAKFDSGLVRALEPSEYTITGFDSTTAGEKTVTVTLNENPQISTSFKVSVKNSILQGIEITRQPSKTTYYIGDSLNLNGMVISEIYDDSKQVLQSNEYAVDSTGFDSTKAGNYTIVISSKGKTVNLVVTVKTKQISAIEVSTYPKTTFYKGDAFDKTGLIVSKVYDNGDREALAETEYSIDSSAFKGDISGVYIIIITPVDKSLAAITYSVTVREQTGYTWKSIEFGQSTSPANNVVTPSNPGTAEGTIRLKAGSVEPATTGGKVTGAHDGISYYYTEIDGTKDNFELSADIKVVEFAKATPDNQEAFGIMTRDAIGVNGNSDIFSSNVVAVGGYRGTTQAFIRTGVTSYLGNEGTVQTGTSWNTARPDSTNTGAGKYRLTLKKTNSGYTASLNNLADKTVTFYSPDALVVQDSKIYVGFYTARVATIEVSNVDFKVTDAATDAPKVTPPATPVAPTFSISSLSDVSKTDYPLTFTANVNGLVTIKQGENVIVSDMAVTGRQTYTQNTNIAAEGTTNFTVTFTPDTLQTLTSYDRIITNFSVNMKTYSTSDGAIYVSPAGTSSGTGEKTNPLDIDTAIKYVKEGQIIYLLDGNYLRSTPLRIAAGNSGKAGGLKTISAANGAKVVFDFNNKASGFTLSGNYWHIYGIDFARGTGAGVQIGGNNNIVELCRVYENGGTGLQISRTGSLTREFWPSNNLILNCEAFDNRDPSENNADGFAAKLTSGEGNIFRGCISHNNIDDGWDLYTKAETGPIGAVLIENCIAYNNGKLTSGYLGKGDKNGFKLGGEGIAVAHVIRNSMAFGNGAAGFTSNSNPAVQADNNVSFNNTGANIVFSSYTGIPLTFKITNFKSFRNDSSTVADNYPSEVASSSNYFYNGVKSVNNDGNELKSSNFKALNPDLPYKRDSKGDIIWGDFLSYVEHTGNHHAVPQVVNITTGSAAVSPAAGGTVGLGSEAKVQIPSGALSGSTSVTVMVKKVEQAPGAPDTSVLLSPVYSFTVGDQKGYKFASKVTVTLNFDTKLLKGDMKPSIYYYDESAAKWVELGGKVTGSTISVEVDHFTQFAVLALTGDKEIQPVTLNDIKGHWAQNYIEKLITAGAVKGYPDGSFEPDSNITRAEFVAMLVKAFKLEVKSGKTFNDTSGHWAKDYISTAALLGIVKGYDNGSFGADDYITREQMTVMITNVAKLTVSGEASFKDNSSISDWAKSAVAQAVKDGIVKGYDDNTFRPQENATRAEAVTVIVKAMEIKK